MYTPDTITGQFNKVVADNPEKTALIDGETRYTYGELASISSAYSLHLRDRLSPLPGQVVLAWMDNGPELVACFLAAARSSTILFPLNIHWREPELRWFLDRLPVAGVVTKKSLSAAWDQFTNRISHDHIITVDDPNLNDGILQGRAAGPGSEGMPTPSPEDHVVFFSSSGSTGAPKIVPRSHRNIVEGTVCKAGALGISPGHRFLGIVPFYHANGFDNSLALPLLSGATLVLQSDFVPSRFVEAMTRHRIDVFIGSPAIFELLLRFEVDRSCLSTLKICASSGGPIAADNIAAIRRRFGVIIRQVYGSTETGVIAIDPPEGGPPSVPVPNLEIKILGASGEPLPQGEKGEIAVRGPSVVSGYIGGSGDESMVFRNGYYCTGDRGCLDPSGSLELLGRIRPTINLSGTKVDPVEVENAIRTLPGVSSCRVFSVKGPRHNEVIKAVIAVREGATLDRAGIISHCRTLLSEYKIPRIIELVLSIPPDLTGKSPVSWGDRSD